MRKKALRSDQKFFTARVAHISMQYNDTESQKKHDASKIFSQNYDWITGTEAGEKPTHSILRAAAKKSGYRFHRFRGNWIAVKKSLILPGSWRTGGEVVASAGEVHGPGHDSNVVWVQFRIRGVGKITILGSHYPTKGDPASRDSARRVNVKWNKKLAKAIGHKAKVFGKGPALVFYGGDQNLNDRIHDTFFGEPLTSAWDETKVWENTGHGNIDIIASYDGDARVTAGYIHALSDRDFHLYTDHFMVEATFLIRVTA